jgi:leucyl aminopeptidase
MKIQVEDRKDTEWPSDALILPFCEDEKAISYPEIDDALEGLLGRVIASGEFTGKRGQVTMLHSGEKIRPRRILLAGLGKKGEITKERLRQAGGKAASYLDGIGLSHASLSMHHVIDNLCLSPVPFVEGAMLSSYKFRKYKKEDNSKGLKDLTLLGKQEQNLLDSLALTGHLVSGVHFVRDLVNTPSNEMTPSVIAKIAKTLEKHKVSVRVLGRKDAEREGMGAFLSVGQGSREPSKFITLRYKGGKGAPLALIGKTVTFDSGGISLKPAEGMQKMKYDMAGGAVVLAVIKVASEWGLPMNLIGILPATENLPGGSASKPGDIVRTVSGKTVEIISTDAEGRLSIADAIGYVKKFRPKAIIDIATLTGACSIALGNEAIAMMGNDVSIMEGLKTAGEDTCERVWQMPLYEEYGDYIKSEVADLKNTGGKTGSLVAAGYFLKEFAGDTPWVHLDIAGTAWIEKEKPYTPKGATGVGVRLLANFLKEMSHEGN